MNGALVNILFRCDGTSCGCEVVLEAHMFVRESARIYEYQVKTCPNCHHSLFGGHTPVGELFSDVPVPPPSATTALKRRDHN